MALGGSLLSGRSHQARGRASSGSGAASRPGQSWHFRHFFDTKAGRQPESTFKLQFTCYTKLQFTFYTQAERQPEGMLLLQRLVNEKGGAGAAAHVRVAQDAGDHGYDARRRAAPGGQS